MVDQGQILQIKLSRFDCQPWGFRLQGGVDFAAPLLVQKVNAGSLAEQAGLLPGDSVLKINDVDVYNQRHKDAQDIVVRSGNNFVMTVQRGGSTWRPQVTPTGHLPHPNSNSPYLQTVTKTSLAHRPQEVHHIGSGYNNSARPFANGGDGSVKSIVNRQYNTPVGIYSDESIAETLSAQAEVLAGGVLGVNFKKNEKEYQADKSEVLKFLREEETGGDHTPAFNNHQYQEPQQHYHHQQQQQHHHQPQPHHQPSVTRHVSAPVNSPKPPSTGGLPTGQNICDECERLITGVFVRIKDKNLHVECFKCATCGTSLKNQGYYNFNNKLYCDIHAKLAAMQNPPPGTEGYVPVPIKPNTKLSASTISSALNAHGFSNGYSNGGSAPTEEVSDLPLPPPPSPTQLQQFQYDNQYNGNNNSNNNHSRTHSSLSTQSNSGSSTCSSMSPTPMATHTPSNVIMPGNAIEIAFAHNTNNNNKMANNTTPSGGSSCSSLSLDRFISSPTHSRQTSSSSSSLSGGVGGGGGVVADNFVGLTPSSPPPPPPPPMPNDTVESETEMFRNTKNHYNNSNTKVLQQQQQQQQQVARQQQLQQNENDMNMQNKNATAAAMATTTSPVTNNVYNKFLKEYSNKLLTQTNNSNGNNNNNNNNNATIVSPLNKAHNNNSNTLNNTNNNIINNNNSTTNKTHNTNTNNIVKNSPFNKTNFNNNTKITNGTAKPFVASPNAFTTSTPTSSNVAAVTATLANQLKFNTCQIEPSPVVATVETVDTSATSTATAQATSESTSIFNSSSNTSKMFGEEQSSYANTAATAQSGEQSSGGQQPFEYVTLTGNVIRSVVPPGKGGAGKYKVNQGYARPFGSSPAAAAPKSPVSYPPQQQWGGQQQQAPKPAVNPYATLPRSNAGQQGSSAFKPAASSAIASAATSAATAAASAISASAVASQQQQKPSASTNIPPITTTTNMRNQTSGQSNVGDSSGAGKPQGGAFGATSAPKRGRGVFNKAVAPGVRVPLCNSCQMQIRGPFITALGRIWCPDHFICVNGNCRRPLQDIGFVEEKGDLYCEYCFEKYLAPTCSNCAGKIKGDCLNAIGKHFHPECFTCAHCGKLFGNTPFFLEEGKAYCEADWNELFTTKCFACGFPVEAGDRWVEALNHNYHSQCFNCTFCKQNLEGQSFYNKGGRPFCKNHAR